MTDENIIRMIGIMQTSTLLRDALPKVRQLALVETLRASKGWEEGRAMLLENLETSPYIPQESKGPLAEMALSESWDELRVALCCPATVPTNGNRNENSSSVQVTEEADFLGEDHCFRSMVISVFSRSKKMQTISVERRQQIGASIHRASCKEDLMELALTSLESSEAFDMETRGRVANDILDERYDLLLLPDRFDCEDVPRLRLVASSSRGRTCNEDYNKKVAALPTKLSFAEDECPICLGARPVQVSTPCGHGFCRQCIAHWSVTDFVCPVCRARILKEPPMKAANAGRSISLDGDQTSDEIESSSHASRRRGKPLHAQSLPNLGESIVCQQKMNGDESHNMSEASISEDDTKDSDANIRYDKLTVFQAAPLVWADSDGDLHPIELLDYNHEREMLSDALKDAAETGASIDLIFETATTDRLGAFLAAGDGARVLHFSCHGNPDYLCFEDGTGGAHFLRPEDLRAFVAAGGGELHFVFVAACYSRAAGEAFVKAGARHVLCCQHEEPLMDVATAAFTSQFYRSLACGKTLSASFELGQQALKLSPLVPDSENEMGKFLLLPEDVDHDVHVFYTGQTHKRISRSQPKTSSPCWTIPHPPQRFVGREGDMYKVLQALGRARLIKLTGIPGVGKRSLLSAVCHYIQHRKRLFSIEEMIWLPLPRAATCKLSSSLQNMLDLMLQDDSGNACSLLDAESLLASGAIIEGLLEKKVILVVDTQEFSDEPKKLNFVRFLQDLLTGTKYTSIILIDHFGLDLPLQSCIQSEITLEPLGFQLGAVLFGILCPFVLERRCARVCSPRQLATLVVPKGQENLHWYSDTLSKRSAQVFEMIGNGVPREIHRAAQSMQPHEYDALIELGARNESLHELEQQLKDLETQLQKAVSIKDFVRATEIQEARREILMFRKTLPDLDELKEMAKVLSKDLDNAVSSENFLLAKQLNEQLVHVEGKIKREEIAGTAQ